MPYEAVRTHLANACVDYGHPESAIGEGLSFLFSPTARNMPAFAKGQESILVNLSVQVPTSTKFFNAMD